MKDEIIGNLDNYKYKQAIACMNSKGRLKAQNDGSYDAYAKLNETERQKILINYSETYRKADAEAQNWGVGGKHSRALNAGITLATGLLGGQSGLQSAVNAAAPYASEAIGRTFGHGENKNETAQAVGHFLLGAAIARVNGGNFAAGGSAAVAAEKAAEHLAQRYNDGKTAIDPQTGEFNANLLPEHIKEEIKSKSGVIASLTGAAVGGTPVDAQTGGAVGQNAVENNHLLAGQRIQKNAEFRACKADWRCEFEVDKKWEKIGLNNMRKLHAACDKGINTAACQNLRNQIDRSTYQGKRDYNYPTGLELKGELSGALGVGVQANAKVTVTLGNRGSSVQAEGGVGLGIGAALSGGLSKQTRHVGIDENKTLNVSTEIVLGEKQFGTQADNNNATLSTKVEAELKLGPLNHSAAIQGGRQYPDNQVSSLYRGGEVKSVVKPQLEIGGMLKWDIWNGRSKRYEKIR
ncbi:VENN motif pre-toxin domain-containing protein [Neisseria meningitidis]|uniref:VENN motif pre-toxin domain-containing protein n=2 Tax=Neisseria meningitidis TaxID=487 RepID=UPI001F0BA399|nr:VENN motif pre-toxin domain-containing protein [Neisseria meningitidis]